MAITWLWPNGIPSMDEKLTKLTTFIEKPSAARCATRRMHIVNVMNVCPTCTAGNRDLSRATDPPSPDCTRSSSNELQQTMCRTGAEYTR